MSRRVQRGAAVTGTVEGFDFDAEYRTRRGPAVAWRVWGWEQRWEPYTYLATDEDGNEYEETDSEGEWADGVGGRVLARMVGDDHYEPFDRDDLEKIEEDDYCHECGQIGCTADGREREAQ